MLSGHSTRIVPVAWVMADQGAGAMQRVYGIMAGVIELAVLLGGAVGLILAASYLV